jgi:hypothetical protein
VAAGAWDSVREAPIAAISRPLDARGLSVAVFTDVVQPERHVACTQTTEAAKKAKQEPKQIRAARLELVVNDDGNEWHLIGFERKGRDDMSIRCTPTDKRPDNATYAFSTVDGFTERANNGKGIGTIGTVLGIGLALWTFIARRRHAQETDDAPA